MHQNVVRKKVCTKMLLVKKVCTKILFWNNGIIVLDFIDSDIVRFFDDNMDILKVDLNNINLNNVNFDLDDPESIIHVRLMAWRN